MAPVNSISNAICFILFTIVFVAAVESGFSELHNNLTSPWKSGRTKRLISNEIPSKIQIKIKYAMDDEIMLSLVRSPQKLANKYLPVITPFTDFNQNVMENIGDFILFHDEKNCAAIVYFKNLNALYGVIGMAYYIDGLPFDFHDSGMYRLEVVGDPYVKKFELQSTHIASSLYIPPPSDTQAWQDIFRPSKQNQGVKRPSSCEPGPSTKHQRTEQDVDATINGEKTYTAANTIDTIAKRQDHSRDQKFYLEILVLVTRDIVELFKGSVEMADHNERTVRYLITYFNAVDMMFQKLGSYRKRMFINIAKIVIEDDLTPFDFMSNDELQFTDVVTKLPQYLHDYRIYNPPDSFDHVFVYTSRPIMDGTITVNGLTKHGANLYKARQNNRFYDVVPITIVRFEPHYADYGVALHEIARRLNIKIDPQNMGLEWSGQCYAIMQQDGPKCSGCFEWSDSSKNQFIQYFSENRNRCFLINQPRSIRPPQASILITPHQQCKCMGYHSYRLTSHGRSRATILPNECDTPLVCSITERAQSIERHTVWPFDGTSCDSGKVCWENECMPIGVY